MISQHLLENLQKVETTARRYGREGENWAKTWTKVSRSGWLTVDMEEWKEAYAIAQRQWQLGRSEAGLEPVANMPWN